MAETINTAEAAVQISEEIFSTFKWQRQELFDQNVNCEIDEHQKKTHPCDCVFYYIDPYIGKVVYLNTDLKSYGAGSISKTAVSNALKSLALATHCANISSEWKDLFILPESQFDYTIRGFLFVYNHDNEYANNFHEQLSAINPTNIRLAKNQQIHIFGPEQIRECYAISSDLETLKGRQSIERYGFWYPDMILHKVRHGSIWDQPATIELLSSPLIIVKYNTRNNEEGYIIYYRRNGESEEEFLYLIDLLSHYQILSESLPINLRFISNNASPKIQTNFKNGKYRYMQDWSMDDVREAQLNLIKPEKVSRHVPHYNIGELGWRE
ncbi:hypothetical protein [Pseudoalteromonas rubra]|uniref:hypothetical protein n=1 Tax=Pseudoalteromonas rubra TaxID=43658 RepID=UPI000F770D8C|nr:hypothetical protein [Pseudoalteromonas rubra]